MDGHETGVRMRRARGRISGTSWLGRMPMADSRGVAFMMTLYIVFAIGMMLAGFVFFSQNEARFAAYNRNSTQALGLAEAGIQEGINRLNNSGATPGLTSVTPCPGLPQAAFAGSLAAGTPGGCGVVIYQATLASNSSVFPILSVATFGGTQRAVRVFEQALYKTGFGNVVYGPQVTFQGNAQPITGNSYSQTSMMFQTGSKAPQPAPSATATNLVPPQVMAGTWIDTQGSGPGHFIQECSSLAEVAPTNCTGTRNASLPVNWHPATPIGMPSADFNTVVTKWNGKNANLPGGLQVVQAAKSGTGVTYTPTGAPGGYTPSYWSVVSGTNGEVLLIVSPQGGGLFCVNASGSAVTAGACTSGGNTYGTSTIDSVINTTDPMRYLDWGLVADDLTRGVATTFFQTSTCSTCYTGGGPNGNQNGIQYIPYPPAINVLAVACGNNNTNPGFSAFYNTSADGKTCANPPTQAGSATFTGTKSNPEVLVIDDGPPGGTPVSISGTGSATGCSDTFANANWGVILATGDIKLQGFAFNGFIYTLGSVFSYGNSVIRGGIFSASGSTVNQMDYFGTMAFCGGTSSASTLSPLFFTFQTLSWQDRPGNQR